MKIVIVGGTGLIGSRVAARPREVVADPPAHYFGAETRERDLVPDDGAATLGEIEYAGRPATPHEPSRDAAARGRRHARAEIATLDDLREHLQRAIELEHATLPPYPRRLPHGDPSLELPLLPFGPEALDMFLRLERPAPPGAPPEGDAYETIGQFYEAVGDGLRHLCDRLGEREVLTGDPAGDGGTTEKGRKA